jgi:soluble lytic murein transglycosylase-like protein
MLSRQLLPLATCLALAGSLVAKESICFNTGFCMEADSHTQQDGVVKLRTRGGTIEFPADQISQISVLADAPASAETVHNVVPSATASNGAEDSLLRAAIEEGLEPDFVRSVARVESGLHQEAVSPKGAVGVMQLMPATAAGLGVDPKLTDQNALGGAKFLRELLLRYGGDSARALAAYNAGPGAVDKFGGVPPFFETRQYVIKVLQEYARRQRLQAKDPVANTAATASHPAATPTAASKPIATN